MTPKFIPGAIYESTTHGLVEFKGVDRYMGQATLHFVSLKHGNCYWLPETLDMHFASTPETRPEYCCDINATYPGKHRSGCPAENR